MRQTRLDLPSLDLAPGQMEAGGGGLRIPLQGALEGCGGLRRNLTLGGHHQGLAKGFPQVGPLGGQAQGLTQGAGGGRGVA